MTRLPFVIGAAMDEPFAASAMTAAAHHDSARRDSCPIDPPTLR
jgi:hypothetical protein